MLNFHLKTWLRGSGEVNIIAETKEELVLGLEMLELARQPIEDLYEQQCLKDRVTLDKVNVAEEDVGPTYQGTHGSGDDAPPADPTVEAAQPKERSRPRRSRAKPAQTTELEAPVAVVELANGSTITLAPSDETLVGSTTPIIVVEEAPAPSAEDATAAMMKYANVKGIAAARSVLAEFNVTRVGEIAADQRAAFIGRTQDTTK